MYISEDKIAAYLYTRLISLGYVPSADEIWDIAIIFFDYLIEMGVIEEVDTDET